MSKSPDANLAKVAVIAVSLAHKNPPRVISEGTQKSAKELKVDKEFNQRKQDLANAYDCQLDDITIRPFNKSKGDGTLAGHVITVKDQIIVAYHGTNFGNRTEVAHDLQATKAKMSFGGNECTVHSGFKQEFEDSQEEMTTALQEARQEVVSRGMQQPKTLFTGHSLGGAVAQIATLYCAEAPNNSTHRIPAEQTQNITFGAPRVFGAKAAQLYDEKLSSCTLRVKLGRDPVTGLPPAIMGFKHVGKKVVLDGKGHTGGAYRNRTDSIDNKMGQETNEDSSFSITAYLEAIKASLKQLKTMISFDKVADKMKAGFSQRNNPSTPSMSRATTGRTNGASLDH